MTEILQKALIEAAKVRKELGINDYEPINIFDICRRLQVDVRFDNINMEGVYVTNNKHPYIILSGLRPMPRRVFTCAHELGHHRFGHGDKIDGLNEEGTESDELEEKLVDMFAGALLMPAGAIQSQFNKRKWAITAANPIEFQTVASAFSTGYQTLVSHCNASKLITSGQKLALLKVKPNQIFKRITTSQNENSFFKIIDRFSRITVTDIEVNNYIFLPMDFIVEGTHLNKIEITSNGTVYKAIKPGIVRAAAMANDSSLFIRIQRFGYEGWAENRHLDN